ncbi:hypothetical protein CEUSTIGMA_g11857.t1 [Chlamydomonas eustigma]|uniref:5'-3' exonuclease domain-containing protein n=1 Tax=Chlamydomonas eustigma TaxID=1157962 RepID=A0A250XMZ2_9CHLO|nr:hypothetical protein CEUSTIGMA_g11857.t1 [Chlamydomonas eustigma]|eukprot:GAX84437.1 hypothetical protein CEUSTIGMA_g11857.t1 [Chlamydomonas eustigma]
METFSCDYLIVDGTNLLCNALSGQHEASVASAILLGNLSTTKQAHATSFHAWLRFVMRSAAPSTVTFIVFDSRHGGKSKRQQLNPNYLQKRQLSKTGKEPASTPFSRSKQSVHGHQSSRQRLGVFVDVAEALGCVVLWSEPGLEADDKIGSLVSGLVQRKHRWRETQSPKPILSSLNSPRIAVCSSDSDMQQLLSYSVASSVFWMELLPWPVITPCANDHVTLMETQVSANMPWLPIRFHTIPLPTASGVNEQHGLEHACDELLEDHLPSCSDIPAKLSVTSTSGKLLDPGMYPHFLALVGKPEAGIRGVGLSSKAACTLLARFQSVQGISEALALGLIDKELRVCPPRSKQPPQDHGVRPQDRIGGTANRSTPQPQPPQDHGVRPQDRIGGTANRSTPQPQKPQDHGVRPQDRIGGTANRSTPQPQKPHSCQVQLSTPQPQKPHSCQVQLSTPQPQKPHSCQVQLSTPQPQPPHSCQVQLSTTTPPAQEKVAMALRNLSITQIQCNSNTVLWEDLAAVMGSVQHLPAVPSAGSGGQQLESASPTIGSEGTGPSNHIVDSHTALQPWQQISNMLSSCSHSSTTCTGQGYPNPCGESFATNSKTQICDSPNQTTPEAFLPTALMLSLASAHADKDSLMLLYPPHYWHMLTLQPYLEALALSLQQMRISFRTGHITPSGLIIDVDILSEDVSSSNQLHITGHATVLKSTTSPHLQSSSSNCNCMCEEATPTESSACRASGDKGTTREAVTRIPLTTKPPNLSILILAPGDFAIPFKEAAAEPVTQGNLSRSEVWAETYAVQLQEALGKHFLSLDALPQKLKTMLSAVTQMRIRQTKKERSSVAVIPFYAFQRVHHLKQQHQPRGAHQKTGGPSSSDHLRRVEKEPHFLELPISLLFREDIAHDIDEKLGFTMSESYQEALRAWLEAHS